MRARRSEALVLGASYEVASHPFDVYALARGWRHFKHDRYAQGAANAFRAWVRHLGADGEPHDHEPGPGRTKSYQCPLFWAGHGSWLARSIEDLENIVSRPEAESTGRGALELSIQLFPNASLARLEDGAVAAWIRGARPAFNVHHGSPHGAGLVRVYSKSAQADVLDRVRHEWLGEAEWGGRERRSIARGWNNSSQELRFSAWLARNHWRGDRRRDALLTPLRVFRDGVLTFADGRVSSAFHLAPEMILLSDGLTMMSRLARRDGSPIEDSSVRRTYRIDGDGLLVEDRWSSRGRPPRSSTASRYAHATSWPRKARSATA